MQHNKQIAVQATNQPSVSALRSWLRTPALLTLVGLFCVLLVSTALADSPTEVDANHAPPVPTVPPIILFSIASSGSVPTSVNVAAAAAPDAADAVIKFQDEDILALDLNVGTWSLYFDGSAHGLTQANLEDFELLPDDDIIFTLNKPFRIPNPNGTPKPLAVLDADVVRFDAATQAFSFYLRGADIGLTTASEDIDALGILPSGNLLISTIGTAKAKGPGNAVVTAYDEDVLECDVTAKTCTLYIDGSDLKLDTGGEDIDAIWFDNTAGHDPNHYLTTKNAYNAKSTPNTVAGDFDDILGCYPTSLGDSTVCFLYKWLNGDQYKLHKNIDGLWVTFAPLVASSAVSAAAPADEPADEPLDADDFNEAMAAGDPEIDVYDFYADVKDLFLPLVER